MNVQVYYHKRTGIAEVCVSVQRRVIDVDRINVYEITPDYVPVQGGPDPTSERDVRFCELGTEAQSAIIEQAIKDYCAKQGNTVTEFHTYN